jgi:uncharacterized protein YecE (DUF72 family)
MPISPVPLVGTSGFNYPEWRGNFYPEDIASKEMFGYYSARFTTVEINYTFYRMPTAKMTSAWEAQAPPGFVYALKAPQRITHQKRLLDCADPLQFFCDSARVLGAHLGPLLFQLPPNFRCNLERLETFLALVPRDLRAAFEFRHESWHDTAVFDVLRERNLALCVADSEKMSTPVEVTADYAYLRLRDEGYQPGDIVRWAETIKALPSITDAFVYFKHEEQGKGPELARLLVEKLQA